MITSTDLRRIKSKLAKNLKKQIAVYKYFVNVWLIYYTNYVRLTKTLNFINFTFFI